MKSRHLSFFVLSVLLFFLPLTDLVAKPPSTVERVAILEAQVAELQALLLDVSRLNDPNTGQDTLRFAGMNVQIVNDEDVTETTNGTGNLIIGYNESRDNPPICPIDRECDRRGGSHNLVMGYRNNYSEFGGIVAGYENEISGSYASVTGGRDNLADGEYSSVSGGRDNRAGGEGSSVTGGGGNWASGAGSSVSGGASNTASAYVSSVSGGDQNEASGSFSSVSGGAWRDAPDVDDWVAGGLFQDN
jgi:hypothetical protein